MVARVADIRSWSDAEIDWAKGVGERHLTNSRTFIGPSLTLFGISIATIGIAANLQAWPAAVAGLVAAILSGWLFLLYSARVREATWQLAALDAAKATRPPPPPRRSCRLRDLSAGRGPQRS